MAEAPGSAPALHASAGGSLAKERLIWAVKPLGFLFIVLWILHPSTVDHADYLRMSLIGFLTGTFYGLIVYGKVLRSYTKINQTPQRFKPNRVPEEYYWGNIMQMMFDNR